MSPLAANPATPRQTALGCFIMLMLGLVGFVALGKSCDPGEEDPNEWGAIAAAREALKAHLVSPGSAEFPFGTSRIAARTQDGQYLALFLVVDSQNGFGALLRSYGLVLVWDRKDRVEAVHTLVFENSPTAADLRKITEEIGESWQIEQWVTASK